MSLARPIVPPAPTVPTTAAPRPSGDEEPRPLRFALDDYLAMAEAGRFGEARTEFIDGEILRMPPQKNDHAYAVTMLFRALDRLVGDRHWVRCQATLRVADVAAPEPDIAVVSGPPQPGDDIPAAALLVIEVSDTTLRYDRTTKASLYAMAGVPEYWIVNLIDGRVEVYRQPVDDASAPFGRAYGRVESFARDGTLAWPASLGEAGEIPAANVLP